MLKNIILFSGLAMLCCTGAEKPVSEAETVEVNPAHFIKESLVGEISKEMRSLADGTKVMCYVIKTKSEPHEHTMGPWSPKHVSDGKDKGGIWLRDGKVYDVDGAFVKNLPLFYNDKAWNLVREDGSIRITDTQEAFEAAARPNVDPRYHNHSVEGDPAWYPNVEVTYVIPVKPVYHKTTTRFGRGAVGVAFNGVNFDPPAPLEMIIKAHTIAPLDDSGGHLNPHAGYHYHAVTGKTKEVAQKDGHAPMIGYALDGFGMYATLDAKGNAAKDLDECGGHYDAIRGYHYHVGAAGSNQILKAFRGKPGLMTVAGMMDDEADKKGPPAGAPPHDHTHPHSHEHPHPHPPKK